MRSGDAGRDRSSDGSGSKQTAARLKLTHGVQSPRGTYDLCGSVERPLQAIPRQQQLDIVLRTIEAVINEDTRGRPVRRCLRHQFSQILPRIFRMPSSSRSGYAVRNGLRSGYAANASSTRRTVSRISQMHGSIRWSAPDPVADLPSGAAVRQPLRFFPARSPASSHSPRSA